MVTYTSPVPFSGVTLDLIDSSFSSAEINILQATSSGGGVPITFSLVNENSLLAILSAIPTDAPALFLTIVLEGSSVVGQPICITNAVVGKPAIRMGGERQLRGKRGVRVCLFWID